MYLELHPDLSVQQVELGTEGAPLLIVDQFVADPDRLVSKAARSHFIPIGRMFPGIRARAPANYENLLAEFLAPRLQACFGIAPGSLTFPLCHYSLVTRPAASLTFLQRIPHIDTAGGYGLATVHYLFRGDWGGTAFYRHRKTGYETIDEPRLDEYSRSLRQEESEQNAATAGYIDGDTALFEQIASVDGVFNRMIVYRRNSLHSGSIDNGRVPPADAGAGRLSINTFIDVLHQRHA
jgi:hypothetical protein